MSPGPGHPRSGTCATEGQRAPDRCPLDGPEHLTVDQLAVVAVDDDCGFAREPLRRVSARQRVRAARGVEAKVLVEIVVIEPRHCRLEDVRRRDRPRGHSPPSVLASSSAVFACAPARLNWPVNVLPSQLVESSRKSRNRCATSSGAQPGHLAFPLEYLHEGLRPREPDRASAVLADRRGEQREGRRCRHVELAGPAIENAIVVGEETQSHGEMVRSACDSTCRGIESDRGVAPGRVL